MQRKPSDETLFESMEFPDFQYSLQNGWRYSEKKWPETRRLLRSICLLKRGEPPSAGDREWLADVLDELFQNAEDIRPVFFDPPNGRPNTKHRDWLVGADAWFEAERLGKPARITKSLIGVIAERWKLKDATVRKILGRTWTEFRVDHDFPLALRSGIDAELKEQLSRSGRKGR